MSLTKHVRLNVDLIKNMPMDLKAELIIFEDVIPDGIMTSMYVNDPFYNKERRDFLNHRPDLLEKIYHARNQRERLAIAKNTRMVDIETEEEIQFVKEYPQFKDLIKAIIYRDNNLDVVKVVPIDQYLAEN